MSECIKFNGAICFAFPINTKCKKADFEKDQKYDEISRNYTDYQKLANYYLNHDQENNVDIRFYDITPICYNQDGVKIEFELLLSLVTCKEEVEEEVTILAIIPLVDRCADDIIFIKHLFYKQNIKIDNRAQATKSVDAPTQLSHPSNLKSVHCDRDKMADPSPLAVQP